MVWVLVFVWAGMFVLGIEYPVLLNIALGVYWLLGFGGVVLSLWVIMKARERKMHIPTQTILSVLLLVVALIFGVLYQIR